MRVQDGIVANTPVSAKVWLEARLADQITVTWRDPVDGVVAPAQTNRGLASIAVIRVQDHERHLLHLDAGTILKVTVAMMDRHDERAGGDPGHNSDAAKPRLLFASGTLLERLGIPGGRASEPVLVDDR